MIDDIPQLHVSSDEEAVELLLSKSQSSSTAKAQTPIRFYIRQLLYNTLKSCLERNVVGWLAGLPAYNYRHQRKLHLALCIHETLC